MLDTGDYTYSNKKTIIIKPPYITPTALSIMVCVGG